MITQVTSPSGALFLLFAACDIYLNKAIPENDKVMLGIIKVNIPGTGGFANILINSSFDQ